MKTIALLVGSNDPFGGGYLALAEAERDCIRMRNLLDQLGIEVRIQPPERLTAEAVQDDFQKLASRNPDLILFYLAGHAVAKEQGLIFLLPGSTKEVPQGIHLPEIIQNTKFGAGTDIACIIDACASSDRPRVANKKGSIKRPFPQFPGRAATDLRSRGAVAPSPDHMGALLYVLATSTANDAYEIRGSGGVFTSFFLEEMRKALVRENRLHIGSLAKQAGEKTKEMLGRNKKRQSAMIDPQSEVGIYLREFPPLGHFVHLLVCGAQDRLLAGTPERTYLWHRRGPEPECEVLNLSPSSAVLVNKLNFEWIALGEGSPLRHSGMYRFCFGQLLPGKEPEVYHCSRYPLRAVAATLEPSRRWACATADQKLLVWEDGLPVKNWEFKLRGTALALFFVGNQTAVVTDTEILIYEPQAASGFAKWQCPKNQRILYALADPLGRFFYLWVSDRNRSAAFCKIGMRSDERATCQIHGAIPSAVAVSHDGVRLAASPTPAVGERPVVRISMIQDPCTPDEEIELDSDNGIVTALAFSSDNREILYATSRKGISRRYVNSGPALAARQSSL